MSASASVAPRAEGGKPAAEAKGATSAQVALAWLLAFDNLVFNLVFTEVHVRAAGASQSISGEGSNAPPATRGPLLAKRGKMQMKPLAQACMALSVLMITSFAQAEGNDVVPSVGNAEQTMTKQMSGNKGGHLSTGSRINDILNNPAFADFGSLILPQDSRNYDESMRLSDIGSLLPYHSHVDTKVVVSALNHMIDDVNSGTTVFYDFYTEAQKRAEPTREHTGLFFFRGRPGAPFAIIAPGGGFSYVGSVHEGFPYAQEISNLGCNAFVLRYRVGFGGAVATQDMAAAISYVFRNAETLGVSIQGYSLWGSSAGARMAAAIGSHGVAGFGGDDLPKPSTVVMAYTGHSDYSSDEPATFVVVGEQDRIAPPSAMERRIVALREAGNEVAYHKYEDVGHGFGLGTGTSAEGWVADATRFWERSAGEQSPNSDRSDYGCALGESTA